MSDIVKQCVDAAIAAAFKRGDPARVIFKDEVTAIIAIVLEEAARVAEASVKQECCMSYVGGYASPPECCGNPDVTPMYPNEIAAAIRAIILPLQEEKN